MPEIIETTVYRLDELSDAAKDKARAWYREGGFTAVAPTSAMPPDVRSS